MTGSPRPSGVAERGARHHGEQHGSDLAALVAHPVTLLSYLLVSAAAVLRIVGEPEAAGFAWVAAFVGFLWISAPVLIRARIDGKPG